jgi:hypothetical protein
MIRVKYKRAVQVRQIPYLASLPILFKTSILAKAHFRRFECLLMQ